MPPAPYPQAPNLPALFHHRPHHTTSLSPLGTADPIQPYTPAVVRWSPSSPFSLLQPFYPPVLIRLAVSRVSPFSSLLSFSSLSAPATSTGFLARPRRGSRLGSTASKIGKEFASHQPAIHALCLALLSASHSTFAPLWCSTAPPITDIEPSPTTFVNTIPQHLQVPEPAGSVMSTIAVHPPSYSSPLRPRDSDPALRTPKTNTVRTSAAPIEMRRSISSDLSARVVGNHATRSPSNGSPGTSEQQMINPAHNGSKSPNNVQPTYVLATPLQAAVPISICAFSQVRPKILT